MDQDQNSGKSQMHIDPTIPEIFRRMAWSRAKGELFSMLETYYNRESDFIILQSEILDFIQKVESDGLHE